MAVSGLVDAVEGAYVSGWAFDAAHPRRFCKIKIANEAGLVVATGRASHERPDLVELGLGRSDFAFRVALPQITTRQLLRVSADDVVLPNSPLEVGAGLFDGFAIMGDGVLSGWVTERISGFVPPLVTLTDQDGRLIGEMAAAFSADVTDQDFHPAHFRLEMPDWAFENKSLHLVVAANGVPFSTCSQQLRLVGYLDVVTQDRCAGWLFSPDAPTRAFTVEVRQNGRLAGAGLAHLPRGDIAEQYPQAINSGFDFRIRLAIDDVAPHTLSLRLPGSSHDLFGGPFAVASRAGVIALARRAGRVAHLAAGDLAAGNFAVAALLQSALRDVIVRARETDALALLPIAPAMQPRRSGHRLTIIVPVYRDVAITRTCLESVIAVRDAVRDRLLIVEDNSPDEAMADMLVAFAARPNVVLLRNPENLGFVKSVNRGLAFCLGGDVLLLNSDTRLFAGGLDELLGVLHAADDIATVTALSNNATIFSYPHPTHPVQSLPDADWSELAAVALESNRGRAVDVPTAHGFCMLIRAEVLRRLSELNEVFGRGYGEENDFCQRAADLGYRHVAACGVLVEHREMVSFADEKAALLATNIAILEGMYPEYTPTIMAFEKRDPLRIARRALDLHRLGRADGSFMVVIENWLGGGSHKAAAELSSVILQPGQRTISVRCRKDGRIAVEVADPWICAEFAADEVADLLALLDSAKPFGVVVHHLLGYDEAAVRELSTWIGRHRSVVYLHDFYPVCPRVTLIDAADEFCGVAAADICARCVAIGGSHEASRLAEMSVPDHRRLFAELLGRATLVVSPSQDTANWIHRALPTVPIEVIPHPALSRSLPAQVAGRRTNVVLLGAIGPHKGSHHLLDIARRARLTLPDLHFHVLGHTNLDDELAKLGNVTIAGSYRPDELGGLAARAEACAALFLHVWPETYSYTLSEAARLGYVPIVPDIGAPAARVREARFGIVYPFPIVAKQVLAVLEGFASGNLAAGTGDASRLLPPAEPLRRIAALFVPKAPAKNRIERLQHAK